MYCNWASCIAICSRRPLAGGVALIKRAQDADRQQHAGPGVAEGRPRLARPPVALAGDRHRAAAGLGDHVEGEVVLVGAALPEALHLRIDEARVERVQRLPAEPQPLDRAGGEILDKDIGPLRHFLDQREPALGFEVDRDRFLVGVVDHEIIGVGAGLGPAAEPPAGLAALWVLDLDDLGAEPGERLGAGGPRLELREVENPDTRRGNSAPRLIHPSLVTPCEISASDTIEQAGLSLNVFRRIGCRSTR